MNTSLMFSLMRKKSTNQIDDLTDGLVNVMQYSDNNVLYPSFDKVSKDSGVNPEWFYPVFKGAEDFSELNAIIQYVSQESKFENIGELLMGVAIVEMKHLDKLGSFIEAIGGSIEVPYDTSKVAYGSTEKEAIELAIKSEELTIKEYKEIGKKVLELPSNETTEITMQFLSKLIADEEKHIQLFKNQLLTYSNE